MLRQVSSTWRGNASPFNSIVRQRARARRRPITGFFHARRGFRRKYRGHRDRAFAGKRSREFGDGRRRSRQGSRRLRGAARRIARRCLTRPCRRADVVVVGRVVSVEKAGPSSGSEHDPDWWRATIAVTHVEKGQVSGGQISFLYANSLDVRWYKAPKAHPSMAGAWILHKTDATMSALGDYGFGRYGVRAACSDQSLHSVRG